MRLRSYLVGLAVIASSFIAVNPVEAQSRNGGWYKVGCRDANDCFYVLKIGGIWPYIQYKWNHSGPSNIFLMEADCHRSKKRFVNGEEFGWGDFLPGSIGEATFEFVCR